MGGRRGGNTRQPGRHRQLVEAIPKICTKSATECKSAPCNLASPMRSEFMRVKSGLLWFLCLGSLLGVPVLTFCALYWSQGDEGQQMFPGAVFFTFLTLLVSPLAIRGTARYAAALGEGASWFAWRKDQLSSSIAKTAIFGGAGLFLAWTTWAVLGRAHNQWIDGFTAVHLACAAFWFFALRAASVATAPLRLRRKTS